MIATMDNHSDRHRHSGARTCFSFLFTHASSTNIIVDEAYKHTNESCKIVTIPMRALKLKKLLSHILVSLIHVHTLSLLSDILPVVTVS